LYEIVIVLEVDTWDPSIVGFPRCPFIYCIGNAFELCMYSYSLLAHLEKTLSLSLSQYDGSSTKNNKTDTNTNDKSSLAKSK